VNTRVRRRENLSQIKGYRELIERIEAQLRGEGRVFVRFSGTEPVVRVLLEGRDRGEISRYAEEIAGFLERELS
jgi:phosphoglucosamine mutase